METNGCRYWEHEKKIALDGVGLEASLALPPARRGIVMFVHTVGSGKRDRLNRRVADALCSAGIGVLFTDLLTEREQMRISVAEELRFDIPLLAGRVETVTEWLTEEPETRDLGIGYFGAGDGAAVALTAATRFPLTVDAVVCRSGRVDLAGPTVRHVPAATLLIVGEHEGPLVALNRTAFQFLPARKELIIVPGVGRTYREAGAIAATVQAAEEWFGRYLKVRSQAGARP